MAVHGRYGKPCPVCGTPVQRIRYATNEANYCPTCQTSGKLLADRASGGENPVLGVCFGRHDFRWWPVMNRLRISRFALGVALGLCPACQSAGSGAAGEPAKGPAAQAIVQPGAPGQASTVVSNVPAFHDNNFIDADVKFMQGMIHHHHQALLMVAMIPTHTTTEQLLSFGRKIDLSQTREIQSMKTWLTDRHQELPMIHDDGSAMMGAMDMAAMPGMLTAEQMKALDAAKGGTFDELFLTGMIQHHKGALAMVRELRAAGGGMEPNIGAFVSGVDNDQQMEIVRMYGLLGRPVEK
jgi:uncharacterized protein (DUF305 family)